MDGVDNQTEVNNGTDPFPPDTDKDGLSDLEEARLFLNPLDPSDSSLDSDSDGLPDWREFQLGSNPFVADTDGDGHADGVDSQPLDAAFHAFSTPTPGDTTAPTVTLTHPTGATLLP